MTATLLLLQYVHLQEVTKSHISKSSCVIFQNAHGLPANPTGWACYSVKLSETMPSKPNTITAFKNAQKAQKHPCQPTRMNACLHLDKLLSVWSNSARTEQTPRFVQGVRQFLNKMFHAISPRSPKAPDFPSWALLDFKTLDFKSENQKFSYLAYKK